MPRNKKGQKQTSFRPLDTTKKRLKRKKQKMTSKVVHTTTTRSHLEDLLAQELHILGFEHADIKVTLNNIPETIPFSYKTIENKEYEVTTINHYG